MRVKRKTALLLDAIGSRYHTRPSTIYGFHPMDGRGILFDIDVLEIALQEEEETKTVAGQYQEKKRSWNPEVYKDIQRNMM